MREDREPPRLAEEDVTALEQALLAAGRSYGSSAAARNKTLAALGVAGSATLLAGTAQAVPLGTLAKLTWGKIFAAVSLAGAAAVPGYYAWQHHQAKVAAAATVRPPVALVAGAAPTIGPGLAPAVPLAPALDLQATVPAATGAGGDDRSVPAHGGSRSATLAQELSALDAARGLLARGEAAMALARLERYARAYPHGRLAIEAEVLRIDALDAAGRSDAARARAQAFLDRHPHSVLAGRVRTRLGD
jgi:hypothetical protein